MSNTNLEKLRYPIGRFHYDETTALIQQANRIQVLENLPMRLRNSIEHLTEAQLNTPYRPGGWTVKAVIHHMADSHLNSIIRFKWTLTEDKPIIKTYDEKRWATLPDYQKTPIEISLNLLESLHQRWVVLLRAMSPEDWNRTLIHPELNRAINLYEMLALYAWHSEHHYQHVQLVVGKKTLS